MELRGVHHQAVENRLSFSINLITLIPCHQGPISIIPIPIMTASPRSPPFRAEHIGSLLRPDKLIKKRYAIADGSADADSLGPVQDKAIRDVVKLQLDCGIQSLTNGEVSRIMTKIWMGIVADQNISIRDISSGVRCLHTTHRDRDADKTRHLHGDPQWYGRDQLA